MTTPDLYPTQFHHYLTRNLSYVLRLVQGAGPVLSDEVRGQALHTLSYAMQAPAVWPLTRDLFLTLAPKMEQGGQREHWIPYLEEALRQSETQGDGAAAGECHFQLALLYRLMSHFAAAHEHLQAALAGFSALGARRDQARVFNELAWLEHLQYRYDDARRHVEQAIALLEANDSERAMSYRVQGMLAIDHQQWQEAEQYHRWALKLFEQNFDPRRSAWSLQNLAYALSQQKKLADATILYKQAATTLSQLSDHYHVGVVLFNLGFTYKIWGNTLEAISYYKQAEIIFEQLQSKWHSARLYTDMGLSYFEQHDYINAELAFAKSAQIFTELNDDSWRLNAVDGLAMAYLAQNKVLQARVVLEEALQILVNSTKLMNYNYLQNSLSRHLQDAIEAQKNL